MITYTNIIMHVNELLNPLKRPVTDIEMLWLKNCLDWLVTSLSAGFDITELTDTKIVIKDSQKKHGSSEKTDFWTDIYEGSADEMRILVKIAKKYQAQRTLKGMEGKIPC